MLKNKKESCCCSRKLLLLKSYSFLCKTVNSFFDMGKFFATGSVSWCYGDQFFTKLRNFICLKGWTTDFRTFDTKQPFLLREYYNPNGPICLISDTWIPEVNGVSLQMEYLVTLVLEAGEQVLLLRPDLKAGYWGGRYKERLAKQRCCSGLTEVLVPRVANALNPDTSLCFPNGNFLRDILKLHRPRVIYLATVFSLSRCGQNLATELGIPTILRLGTDWTKLTPYYVPLPDCIRAALLDSIVWSMRSKASCVHLLNGDFAEEMETRKIEYYIQPNSVDTDVFHPKNRSKRLRQFWGADDQTLVCCYIGRISYEKSLELAFEAFEAILHRRPKSIFVVVGDGVMLNELRAMYGDREEIKFTGTLTGQALSEHYASSDLYIFPSTFETFGNTIFESMASGTPVLGFSYAALREFITDGICGILADCNLRKGWQRTINDGNIEKSRAFIEAALRAIEAPLKEIGMKARALIVNRFSPSRFVEDFLSNIDCVISQHGNRQAFKK